jgi:DNA-binding response OmpR family regulator
MEYAIDMKKVMIIEDNKDLQEIYKMSFERNGFEVFLEGDGLDGISSVIEKMPDIVILDLMMPNMDGFAFLKSMKQNTSVDIPVVVCSNLSDVDTINRAMKEGAVAVLLKADYSGRQLVDKINVLLDGLKR